MGNVVSEMDSIKEHAVSYFSSLYKDPKLFNISEQMEVLGMYPSMFTRDDVNILGGPISLLEVECTLKEFDWDKRLGPDGWTI